MVTGEYLRQKLVEPLKEKQRAEGRAEGRVEGHAEGRAERDAAWDAAWDAWNRRRMAAEAEGKSFDEPPPSFREHSSNGS